MSEFWKQLKRVASAGSPTGFLTPDEVIQGEIATLPEPPPGLEWKLMDEATRDYRLVKKVMEEEPVLVQEEVSTKRAAVVENLPLSSPKAASESEDPAWELLSDKVSTNSSLVHVAHAGSIRSIASLEEAVGSNSNPSCRSSGGGSRKLARTHSNSTLDSNDNALGPSGKGILGVDYVEHVVLPTDTLQGLCLLYKISSTRLRQANHFSGQSLSLAPKKLVIPISQKALQSGFIRIQDTDAMEYKLHALFAEFPEELTLTEAKA